MHPFDFSRADKIPDAVKSGSRPETRFVAGGTNLVDLMKAGVENPSYVVDINAIAMHAITPVSGGVRVGALVGWCAFGDAAAPGRERGLLHRDVVIDD